jgi:hypothetical protein
MNPIALLVPRTYIDPNNDDVSNKDFNIGTNVEYIAESDTIMDKG